MGQEGLQQLRVALAVGAGLPRHLADVTEHALHRDSSSGNSRYAARDERPVSLASLPQHRLIGVTNI
jgi:hypothetical protein